MKNKSQQYTKIVLWILTSDLSDAIKCNESK